MAFDMPVSTELTVNAEHTIFDSAYVMTHAT